MSFSRKLWLINTRRRGTWRVPEEVTPHTVFSHRATNEDRAVTSFALSMRDTSHAAICYERVYGALSMDARDSAGQIPWKWPVQTLQELAHRAESKGH